VPDGVDRERAGADDPQRGVRQRLDPLGVDIFAEYPVEELVGRFRGDAIGLDRNHRNAPIRVTSWQELYRFPFTM